MISFRHKGDFSKTMQYFAKIKRVIKSSDLEKYGQEGVAALASVTPVDTGLTSRSWYYKVEIKQGTATINFCNSNIQNGVPIAIILQYGHGTRNGGYVVGRDYINPVIQPIFDKIANNAWREVTRL